MNSLAVIVLILTSRYGTETVLGDFGEEHGRTGALAACLPDTSTRYLPFGEFSSTRASSDGSALDALLSVPPWLGDFVDWIPIPDGARFRVRIAPTSFLLGCTLKMNL
jgi:hypothetical protein